MRTEIETLAEFDAVLTATGTLRGAVVQSLDLTDRVSTLVRTDVHDSLFLGCVVPAAVAERLVRDGALVFPRLPAVPFDAYRSALYTPDELYTGLAGGYPETLDGRVYRWTRDSASQLLDGGLAQALHDHFISDAIAEFLPEAGQGVGIMGGHAVRRGSSAHTDAALLGHALARAGRVVVTGGGPGVMEAANLGACLRGSTDEVVAACGALSAAPDFHDGVDAWARAAFAVREAHDCTRPTLGIPTWHYGHEPPNAFATAIAKYFDNAIREDMLLRLCGAGLVYVQGAAGTTQEIFQAVTHNYYALKAHQVRPMVLVGRRYWTEVLPAWPLLRALSRGRIMEPYVHLVDSLAEVADLVA